MIETTVVTAEHDALETPVMKNKKNSNDALETPAKLIISPLADGEASLDPRRSVQLLSTHFSRPTSVSSVQFKRSRVGTFGAGGTNEAGLKLLYYRIWIRGVFWLVPPAPKVLGAR